MHYINDEFKRRPSTGILMTFKDAVRKPYTTVGGYTIALYLSDGERVCNECVVENWKEICEHTIYGYGYGAWGAGFAGIHWEGPDQYCVHCSKAMPSEYGEVNKD